jgi:type IV secretion system protein VirB9
MSVRLALAALLLGSTSPSIAAPATQAQQSGAGNYRLSGSAALRPSRIWDDGLRTYIVWRAEVELPAVFSIGSDGREMLVDGGIRGDLYVLDRVHTMLVFRIDRSVAKARRMAVRR